VINLSNMVSINDTEGKVVVGSMHSLKGLEFKNLIVAGFDQSSFPLKPKGFAGWPETKQQAYLQSEHALYYVVFSRAISQLVVTGIGEKVVLA
jgi:superfamily I DNA/RNA helicase